MGRRPKKSACRVQEMKEIKEGWGKRSFCAGRAVGGGTLDGKGGDKISWGTFNHRKTAKDAGGGTEENLWE